MIFETDQQTLNDLNILGKYKANSIYSLFCQTVTEGGEVLLEQMFMNPLTDAAKIESGWPNSVGSSSTGKSSRWIRGERRGGTLLDDEWIQDVAQNL